MKPEERQKLNMAAAKMREAAAAQQTRETAAERELQLRSEAEELIRQVLETTYTVERPENRNQNQTGTAGPAPIIPATPYAVQSPNSPNQNLSGSYGSSTSSSSPGSDNWPPARSIPIPSSSAYPNRSPSPMSPTTSSNSSASGSRNNQTPSILRPCPSPGSNNPGRNFNRARRVTFEDTSQSSCSSADSPVNFSQSSPEASPPMGGRNCQRPVTAGAQRSYRRTEPFYNSRFPQHQSYVADSSTSSSSSSSRYTSFPDNNLVSPGLPDFSRSESSSRSRPATAPSSASPRPSSLQEFIDSTASSSTGTGTIPGTTAFADLNSSRVESTCSSTSTSTQSAVYCPHCGRPLNMNVNIQAPLDIPNSSDQNMRIRINFFEDSRSDLDGSSNSRRGASNLSGLSNPMGLNCPHCYRRIHLRLNVQQNQNTNGSEEEFNVQIGLLTSPADPGSRNDSSNYLSSANSYSVPLSVFNCGDGPPDNPGDPKPPDGKC